MRTEECIPSFSISTSRSGMKLKFKSEIPNFKCQLVTSLAYVMRIKIADQKGFCWHQRKFRTTTPTDFFCQEFFRMIEVKACVQLKSGLDGPSVMTYKT